VTATWNEQLAKTTKSTSVQPQEVAFLAANAAEAKKGRGTLVLEVGQVTHLADYFVIIGGESVTQVKAIANAITEALEKVGKKPREIEGKREGRWILLDFSDVIVHVLLDKERDFYKLEQFWNQALIVDRDKWLEHNEVTASGGKKT
jgi:ribosome-associated protein